MVLPLNDTSPIHSRFLAFPRVDASAYAKSCTTFTRSAGGGFVSAGPVLRVDVFSLISTFLILDLFNHSYFFNCSYWCRVFLLLFILHFSLFLRPRLLHRIAIPLGVCRSFGMTLLEAFRFSALGLAVVLVLAGRVDATDRR